MGPAEIEFPGGTIRGTQVKRDRLLCEQTYGRRQPSVCPPAPHLHHCDNAELSLQSCYGDVDGFVNSYKVYVTSLFCIGCEGRGHILYIVVQPHHLSHCNLIYSLGFHY